MVVWKKERLSSMFFRLGITKYNNKKQQIVMKLLRNNILFFLACVAMMLSSCGNKSDSTIEEETSSGVVLIQNQSYYEVVLSNGQSLYFSDFDSDGDIEGLVADEDSVSVCTSFGTGFFISETGKIVTNAHVVSNMTSEKEANKSIAAVIESMKKQVAKAYYALGDKLEEAQALYNEANYSDAYSMDDFNKIAAYRDAIVEQRSEYAKVYDGLDEIRPSDSEIKYHNRVSIAYNNTFVTSGSDFSSCVILKSDTEHDLALIQLKDKKTPEGKYIFEVPEEDPLENYSLMEKLAKVFGSDKNEKLFLTGFNHGPALAQTKDGIKAQFNMGTISQRASDRIMYSIPTLQGSSGSAVVNHKGQLVAINYAGISSTQGFNYGIRVKYLIKLLKGVDSGDSDDEFE